MTTSTTPEYARLSPVMKATLRTLALAGGTMRSWELLSQARGCTIRTMKGLVKRDYIAEVGALVRLTAAGVAALDKATQGEVLLPWVDSMASTVWAEAHAEHGARNPQPQKPYTYGVTVPVKSLPRPIEIGNEGRNVIVRTFTTGPFEMTLGEATEFLAATSQAWEAAQTHRRAGTS